MKIKNSFLSGVQLSSTMRFPLLELPVELRLKIYAHYFRSLKPTYPHFCSSPALLLTSRSVYTAAQPLYIKNTTLDLRTTANLVDFLTSLSAPRIKQLRHLSLRALPFPVYTDEDLDSFHTYGFDQVLPLFPDLQLDTLTLTDAYHGPHVDEDSWGHGATYGEVQSLVKSGCGWRKLIYRSESTVWLQPAEFTYGANSVHKTITQGQPGKWDKKIKQRDGPESGAGVRMWIQEGGNWVEVPASEGPASDGHLDVEKEDEFDWDQNDIQSSESKYGNGDGSVQIEIQITRGRDADIIGQSEPLDDFEKELHDLWGRMSWHEIKESGRFLAGSAEDDPTSLL